MCRVWTPLAAWRRSLDSWERGRPPLRPADVRQRVCRRATEEHRHPPSCVRPTSGQIAPWGRKAAHIPQPTGRLSLQILLDQLAGQCISTRLIVAQFPARARGVGLPRPTSANPALRGRGAVSGGEQPSGNSSAQWLSLPLLSLVRIEALDGLVGRPHIGQPRTSKQAHVGRFGGSCGTHVVSGGIHRTPEWRLERPPASTSPGMPPLPPWEGSPGPSVSMVASLP